MFEKTQMRKLQNAKIFKKYGYFSKKHELKKRKNKEKQMNFPNLRNSKMENNFILHFLEKNKKETILLT